MKLKYYLLIIFSLLYGIFINEVYRPSIDESNFISDAGNNLIFVPCSYSLVILIRGKNFYSLPVVVIFMFLTLTFLEILSFFFPIFGTFDFIDIVALGIGSCFTIFFYKDDKSKL